jgi:oxidase EvaA
MEPGTIDLIELGPTVSCSNAEERAKGPSPPLFLSAFLDAPPEQIRYSAIQSEEGGRFYHFQNRYMILELPPETLLDPPDNFIWMTLGQIIDFTKYSYFNIEARNLLSCLSLLEH